MMPDQVDEMLKGYRAAKGRSAHIDVEIDRLRDKLSRTIEADRRELADISAQQYSAMPHGSDIGNPTEQKGMRLANLPASPEAKNIKQRIHELGLTQERHRIVVMFVEAWLQGLTEKERWIIEKQTIDCMSWREVTHWFSSEFGYPAKPDTLKRIKRTAMEKIYAMAE